ncbi:MAG TPA: bifunctional homocysteine S-methyltransferase/methylenetetrahydrofolate reductase [Candidatus Acidoferrales bacterium]|nr:bifunctional homocysteine S-methyltransferase/methylenetetrahydrofolate reductase [Candidatus Acidoferrales bacterium]
MKKTFRERLKDGVIVCDGAMGTLLELYEYDEKPPEIQNIKNPDIVERAHREYIQAGAEIIETNTFSANRMLLEVYHLADRLNEINKSAVEIAKRAAGETVYVAGAVGPTGRLLEPLGKTKIADIRKVFKEQIEILVSGGVDLLILETFLDLNELDAAIDAAKEISPEIPIIAQKTFSEDGVILATDFPVEVVRHIKSKGVDVVGSNCTVGPQRMYGIIKSIYSEDVILSAQPAAGIPTLVDGRSIYHATPEYLATYARQLVEAGVTVIGACCGSTPAHIKAIAEAVHGLKSERTGESRESAVAVKRKTAVKPSTAGKGSTQSEFSKRLALTQSGAGKKFITTLELDIPRGLDISSVIEGARYCMQNGFDAVNITDGARARIRMSSIAISKIIQQETGIEAMTHLAARDRNMIGLQAELLGAHALGLRNILVITGDPAKVGDLPQAKSVFDVDSVGLIKIVKNLNCGMDSVGNPIGEATSFLIACAANPSADSFDYELEKLGRKVESGADVIFTQPIYEVGMFERFIKAVEPLHVPVVIGILPLRSHKHAEFLHHEIPGINIPEKIREKMFRSGENAAQVGIDISAEFLREIKSAVAGAYLLPPFKKYEVAIKVLEAAGI